MSLFISLLERFSTIVYIELYNSLLTISLFLLKVQPYHVENATDFSVADNCIGYFTEAGWMGIISMVILIIIIYLAILCAFSIKTLDQFEDPRGQTISVEKLH